MGAPLKKNYSILIVDDDKFLIDMYTVKFKEAGYSVTPAFGGEEAIKKLKDGCVPDCILLDVVMPGMNGLELLRKIRSEKLAPEGTAVVILSNQGQPSDIEEAERVGIDGYIIKASTIPSEVLEKVEEITSGKKKK
ncbi:MAG: response regulator [Patescibacteria group bacterium]